MERFASATCLLTDQVWDEPDRPEAHLFFGCPTGAAMPLMWAHAEYVKLLRSAHDLNDIIVEVPPVSGTLLAFKRSNNSWHGHEPFAGERRVIQFNWLTSQGNRQIAMLRHHTSASFKRMLQMILPNRA